VCEALEPRRLLAAGLGETTGLVQVVAPAPKAPAVYRVVVVPGESFIELAWTNTTTSAGVVIVRRQGAAITAKPLDRITYAVGISLGGGTVVAVGQADHYIDTGLPDGQSFTYALYAYDADRDYSAAVVRRAAPRSEDFAATIHVTPQAGFGGYNLDLAAGRYVLVTLDMQLVGDDPGPALKWQWEHGIERIWSGQFSLGDGAADLPIVVDCRFVTSNPDEVVNVTAGTGMMDTANWYTANPSNWDNSWQDELAAHEAGHYLGLYDEYPPSEGGLLDPKNPIIDDTSIMGAVTGAPEQRHYEGIAAQAQRLTGRRMRLLAGTLYGPAVQPVVLRIYAPDGDSRAHPRKVTAFVGTRLLSGGVGPHDRADYYRLSVAKTGRLRVSLSGLSAGASLAVLDVAGHVLASSDQPGRSPERIVIADARGPVVVRVTGLKWPTRYRLSLQIKPT
jgi:hypothetical protein